MGYEGNDNVVVTYSGSKQDSMLATYIGTNHRPIMHNTFTGVALRCHDILVLKNNIFVEIKVSRSTRSTTSYYTSNKQTASNAQSDS